jgi:hypothetical protein
VPPWLRNVVILVVLGVWVVVVAAYLIVGELPTPALLGVPGAVVVAVLGAGRLSRRKPDPDEDE